MSITKKKFLEITPNLTPDKILWWNEDEENEQFTIKEFLETKPNTGDMLRWNETRINEKITKQEFLKAKPNDYEKKCWNLNKSNEKIIISYS